MSFEALLDDLDALQKARAPHVEPDADNAGGPPDGDADNRADDKAIQAAASGDADRDGRPDGRDLPELDDRKQDDDEDDADEDEDDVLGKAFAVTLGNGKTVQAYDGTALIKALHQRIDAQESQTRVALEKTTALLKAVLQDLAVLTAQGRGRKSVLAAPDKPSAGAASSAAPARALMAKAMAAQKTGALTGADVARLETYLGRGLPVPTDLADVLNSVV